MCGLKMPRCPVKKLDPDTCLDFSTRGDAVTDDYRRGWDAVFSHDSDDTHEPVERNADNKQQQKES